MVRRGDRSFWIAMDSMAAPFFRLAFLASVPDFLALGAFFGRGHAARCTAIVWSEGNESIGAWFENVEVLEKPRMVPSPSDRGHSLQATSEVSVAVRRT